ncbi:MAG: cell division topological specificity factor MinE [Gammaproteobacteria bacterium]|nr:MAG: cell division topological specificity factor MinE [Gammaproteobacteria bacterium]
MALFGIFGKKKAPSASLAKERLKIIVEHSRADAKRPDFLDDMRREILAVVNKYVQIDLSDINTNINHKGESEVLELNILLPDTVGIEKQNKASAETAENS